MSLPDASTLCVTISPGSQALCIQLPGGATVCANYPLTGIPDPSEAARSVLGQLSAAVAPLSPVFKLIDAAMSLFNAVSAAKDVVWEPWKLVDALVDVARKIDAPKSLIPKLSVPLMIGGALDVLIAYLQGTYTQLQGFIIAQAQIVAASARASALGNANLLAVATCATTQLNVQITALNDSLEPLNQLLAVLNLFLRLIGRTPIPDLNDLGTIPASALAPLATTIQTLQTLRLAFP
jgi:hypothetical protein